MSTEDKATTPHWRYRLIFTALAPLLIAHSLWQGFKNKNLRLAKQRLGLSLPKRNDKPLWVHMASVGEANAAYLLIKEIQQQYPELPIIVSTITPTGAATAQQKLNDKVEHFYLPLDFSTTSHAALKAINPRCTIIIETELWPRLYYQCKKQHVPLIIVNGRLSQRTLKRPAWVHEFYKRALKNVTKILARSENDADSFIKLGAAPEKVAVIDNIKFASNPEANECIKPIPLPRPYVVAASTHNDEEFQISKAWLKAGLDSTHLLVIVPRHPHRKQIILEQFTNIDAPIAVRSNEDRVTSRTKIYLADTFGELKQFIAGADLTFIGGSLIPRGGQNVIEVAQLGKTALFGPHMENFEDERDLLINGDAAIKVEDSEELISKIQYLLSKPEKIKMIGAKAKLLVDAKGDVARRYVEALRPYLS
jgi:3-deoxy-D-manno-octulosonic-acid transferase